MNLAWLYSPEMLSVLALVGIGVGWVILFGWVSRRIERQADTFAVQHLATQREAPMRDQTGHVLIDPESAQTMIDALQQVAELNHIPPRKRSWRHGSIAWRQTYLRDLVGPCADALPIDQQMRWINLTALAALIFFFVMQNLTQPGATNLLLGI